MMMIIKNANRSTINQIHYYTLDLKINQFKLDMNDVNDLNINNYYFNQFRFGIIFI